MVDAPETRESLLIRVRDPQDRDAWDQFVSIYRPVVYRLARQKGLQDADAQDLTQRVLLAVSQAIPSWRPQDGSRFRNWLARVAKNALINLLSRKPKDLAEGGSGEWLDRQGSADHELQEHYEREYQRQLYRRAAEIVRHRADENTWLAFSLTMVDGLSTSKAAQKLGLSIGSIYAARSRIVRRLRDQVQQLSEDTQDQTLTNQTQTENSLADSEQSSKGQVDEN